ncbi:MAG: hypothetical protein IJL81_05285, partial [Clostridia bacterium]|nr:hypothetical protein [Clostridia bacterium]
VRDCEMTAQMCIEGVSSICADVHTLTAPLDAENNFDNPTNVAPVKSKFKTDTNEFEYTFPSESVTVFEIEKKA